MASPTSVPLPWHVVPLQPTPTNVPIGAERTWPFVFRSAILLASSSAQACILPPCVTVRLMLDADVVQLPFWHDVQQLRRDTDTLRPRLAASASETDNTHTRATIKLTIRANIILISIMGHVVDDPGLTTSAPATTGRFLCNTYSITANYGFSVVSTNRTSVSSICIIPSWNHIISSSY